MEAKVRVLFIEDSARDAELAEYELRKGGVECEVRRVESLEQIRRTLEEFEPDIILSDYTLPRLDGLGALEFCREFRPAVPFIFVSGTIGEERAIESLKRGATDYVIKDNLSALALKVKRALREVAERERRTELEEQLRQSQKMEAIGRLAGGVAHDFNNMLTAITGYAELLKERFADGREIQEELEEILKAGRRASELTSQLLAFARQQVVRPRVMNLNRVVEEIRSFLGRLLGEDIRLVLLQAPDLSNIRADPGQMQQVLMNLAVNARDAMPEGGILTIETRDVVLAEETAVADDRLPSGAYVQLTVSDTGAGIEPSVLPRIFEPFFSTKEREGTGLGLATAYGIVRQCDGGILVTSPPQGGTTFRIYLPQVADAIESGRVRVGEVPLEGNETLLVVEDDNAVRDFLVRSLSARGYEVLPAASAAEALEIARARLEMIDLLLTDVVLPGRGGRDLAESVRRLRSDIKIVYMSGYTPSGVVRRGIVEGGEPFLQKPFAPSLLCHRIREVLDGEG